MFEKDIRFPDDFDFLKMKQGDYTTIISKENLQWGVKDLYIVISIRYHESGYDAMICIGKDVDQIYGDKEEVTRKINEHICDFFRKRAREKGLEYRY